MSPLWKEILWRQFGAAIDTLQNAIDACPEELWQARLWRESEVPLVFVEFWYSAYHTIFYLDYDFSESAEEFTPTPPFTHTAHDMYEVLPERVYTKQELLTYLEHARTKCQAKIESLADVNEPQRIRKNHPIKTVAELILYELRHVQEHAAQLNMLLGQKKDSAPGWVRQAAVR